MHRCDYREQAEDVVGDGAVASLYLAQIVLAHVASPMALVMTASRS